MVLKKVSLQQYVYTNVLKAVVEYYKSVGNRLFSSFLDFNKAFNKVNYWRLVTELLNDGLNTCIVNLLAYRYSNQAIAVKWLLVIPDSFCTNNGTRQLREPFIATVFSTLH